MTDSDAVEHLQAELTEINETLRQYGLSTAQRARAVKRRVEIWNILYREDLEAWAAKHPEHLPQAAPSAEALPAKRPQSVAQIEPTAAGLAHLVAWENRLSAPAVKIRKMKRR